MLFVTTTTRNLILKYSFPSCFICTSRLVLSTIYMALIYGHHDASFVHFDCYNYLHFCSQQICSLVASHSSMTRAVYPYKWEFCMFGIHCQIWPFWTVCNTDWEPVTRLLWWCQCGTSQPIVITTTSILMLDVVDIQVLLRSASLPLILAEKPNLICLHFHARCCRHQVSTLLSDKTSPVLAEKPLASTKE